MHWTTDEESVRRLIPAEPIAASSHDAQMIDFHNAEKGSDNVARL